MVKIKFDLSMEDLAGNTKTGRPIKINDTEGNAEDRNQTIISRNYIKQIVEPALVKACETLYDKNIMTLESSANSDDVERGFAGIVIDYDTLSENNKKIVDDQFGGHIITGDKIEASMIKIPLSVSSTTTEVEKKSLELVNKFEKQSLIWTRVLTFKEVVKEYTRGEDMTGLKPEDFSDAYYFDKENGVFFLSKEHYEKLKENKELFGKMVEEAKSR